MDVYQFIALGVVGMGYTVVKLLLRVSRLERTLAKVMALQGAMLIASPQTLAAMEENGTLMPKRGLEEQG